MRRRGLAAILAAVIAASGCTTFGIDNVDIYKTVPVTARQTKVIDGITYTKTEYADGSVEYTAHNSPPKGYTGTWSAQPGYRGSTIYVGPKGTRRTIEAQGNPPPDPLDPKIWGEPQVIVTPVAQPVSAPLAGPTSNLTPRPRGEGGAGGGGGDGGGGGGGH